MTESAPALEFTPEREQEIRALYVNCIDDLRVSYMVHVGLQIQHWCLVPREVCIREHSYWMRLPGPITLKVHESQEQRIILHKTRLARFADKETA